MAVKKKILIVNDFLFGGGVEKLMHDLVWALHEKYDLTVFTCTHEEHAEEVLPENVDYFCPMFIPEVRKTLTEKVYYKAAGKLNERDLEHRFSNSGFSLVICMKEGWLMQKVDAMRDIPEKMVWVHTDYNNYYYTYDFYKGPQNELEVMKHFKYVVCVSEDIRRGILDQLGDPGNLLVKYNPIHIENILEKAQEPVVDVERPADAPLFVTVGRLNYQKGYDLLLEACHMLEQDGLDYELWIVGGEEPWSDEHNRLYRKHRKLGLKNVKFLGGRKNPYKYMRCADWFLSSSVFEGYSLVSQEAAVLDIPMLLTDCSGVRELLGDSEYGVVMDISVLDIYRRMKQIIENPALHEHYKKKIMERKAIINFEERLREIEDLFDE